MTTIGILGAGQLGRMLALAGYPLGHRFRFLDPASGAPAGWLAEHLTFGYADKSALGKFMNGLDIITYEFENVPVEVARTLEKFVPVYPPPIALEKAQDRFVEKSFFCELGIPTPEFTTEIHSSFSFPAVLKTRRLGYDGKGQKIVNSQADLENEKPQGLILEEFISFDHELSIIAVRNKSSSRGDLALVTCDRNCIPRITTASRRIRQKGNDDSGLHWCVGNRIL
jgi:5-(carboxyamino)imidazole ribonucleotide synthase